MTTSRRGFIIGAAALFCAPAIVRASSLMPVRERKPPVWATVTDSTHRPHHYRIDTSRGLCTVTLPGTPFSREVFVIDGVPMGETVVQMQSNLILPRPL